MYARRKLAPLTGRSCEMSASEILQYLKTRGQCLDSEISIAMGVPLSEVLTSLDDLAARKEVSLCSVTRFDDSKPIHSTMVRASGFLPPVAPGRKPSAKR